MASKIDDRIRQRVIAARKDAGLGRAYVAKAMGLEYQSYSHYERGRFAFTVEQLFQLSRILGRPVEWFLGLDTDLTDDEGQLLTLYRRAKEAGLDDNLLRIVKAFVGEE